MLPRTHWILACLSSLLVTTLAWAASADPPDDDAPDEEVAEAEAEVIEADAEVAESEVVDVPRAEIRQVQVAQPAQPIQPAQPAQPAQPTTPAAPEQPMGAGPGGGLVTSLYGAGGFDLTALPEDRRATAAQPAATVVTGSESASRNSTDTGSLLGKSLATGGVEIQRRSPISNEARIRGYHVGQLLTVADGAFWFPARQDLDTMLSKIDSGIIRDIIILKGPYSVLYGPGFSFIDIETTGTPRYQNGCEWHERTSVNYQTNGEQIAGRQTIWGGSGDWGFRVGYGHRTGNDYETGNDSTIPSSYKSRDIDTAFGIDLTESSRLEVGYLRLDQTDVEYPGQVFDINFLVTDGHTVRYILEDQRCFDRLTLDSWYNRTRFEGDAQGSGKRRQIPELNATNATPPGILNFIGFTDSDEMSTGYRAAMTWGEPDCPQLTVGSDLRYIELELNEFDVFDPPAGTGTLANFPIPRSHHSNPGVFLEGVLPITDSLSVKSGSRFDTVSTDVEGMTEGRTNADMRTILDTDDFDQDFTLWAAYITVEYKMDCHWTTDFGFGTAQRPPTLTELYAIDPFLAILQQGFTQVRGNPYLRAERFYQIDIGLNVDYGHFRAGLSGFYAWIHDYITYEARDDSLSAAGLEGGLGVTFVNTDMASLSGTEFYGEWDCTDSITPFARLSYFE
jgi:iron complex outermembrane receptor protein